MPVVIQMAPVAILQTPVEILQTLVEILQTLVAILQRVARQRSRALVASPAKMSEAHAESHSAVQLAHQTIPQRTTASTCLLKRSQS